MKDLTKGPIHQHIISMSVPIAIGLLIQTLYFLIDLYFVGRLGEVALAGVSTAGNLFFFVMGLTQIFNVGCATLIAHAIGAKNQLKAQKVYSHAVFYGWFMTAFTLLAGYLLAGNYSSLLTADEQTFQASLSYFYWFLPSLALQFILTVIAASMRGAGVVKPFMMIQMLALIVNAILSPVLITGAGIMPAMNEAGAGFASSISAFLALAMALIYLAKAQGLLTLDKQNVKPDNNTLAAILKVGVPAGAEFLLTFFYMAVIYWALSRYGATEQAGFGLAGRIMQALFLPVMAIAFAAPAIAGQNYAAGKVKRVYQTYKITSIFTVSLMILVAIPCILIPESLLMPFSEQAEVITFGATFLSYVGFNFAPAGFVFAAASLFQAFGNTLPSLASTFFRVGLFTLGIFYFDAMNQLTPTVIWTLSVATVFAQALLSFILLNKELKQRLKVRFLTANNTKTNSVLSK